MVLEMFTAGPERHHHCDGHLLGRDFPATAREVGHGTKASRSFPAASQRPLLVECKIEPAVERETKESSCSPTKQDRKRLGLELKGG